MTDLRALLLQPLTEPAFQKALIGGGLVAIVCGVMGCFVILRRMAFLGDALSHAMLAGVTGGYLFMQIVFGIEAHAPGMLVGSIIAGLITVGLINFVSKVSRIKEDTAIGVMYTGIFAVGGVLASLFSHRIHVDLNHFVMGMVLGVDDTDLWMMGIVAAFVLAVVILLFRELQITTFDPVMASSIGVSVVFFDYLLTTCTSLVVVSAVTLVGVILVVGLLVTPAATAYLLCNRLSCMMMLSAVFGVTSVVLGLYFSMWIGNVATGPSIVIVSTLQFLIVLAVAPNYGFIAGYRRRRAQVPQSMIEDIVGAFRHASAESISLPEITKLVGVSGETVDRTVKAMKRDGLLLEDKAGYRLSDEGRREARRLLRAHRLWETYLEHVGTPPDQVHDIAHHLEHVHDEEAVDYLDDKLGHPLHDPHGASIPEDFVHLVRGALVRASLLRSGHYGTVEAIGEAAQGHGIEVGQRITAGDRTDDGLGWTFETSDARSIQLDHLAADALTIRLLGPETLNP